MIDVSEKTQEILLNYMLGLTPDTLNKREGSLIRTSLAAAAWAMEGLYINLEYVQRQAYGTTATGTYLDKIAATAGLVRKPATYAQLNARFNIEIPIGTRFVKDTDDGDRVYFDLVSIANSPSTDPRYVDAPYLGVVEAEEAGSYPNILRGDLSLISFVVGLSTATIVDVHEYGEDEETDALLRARYLEAIGRVDFGGNIQSYRNYVLAQDGVGAEHLPEARMLPHALFVNGVVPDELSRVADDSLREDNRIGNRCYICCFAGNDACSV